jgi:hypothetical protein
MSGMTLGMTIMANGGAALKTFSGLHSQLTSLQNAARQAGAQI